MDIVVLAGGISTERDVSLISGSLVAKALKKNGHRVILLDVFLGYGKEGEDMTGIFDHAEELGTDVSAIQNSAPDIAAVKAMREDKSNAFFGPNVISMCRQADIVFMGLHGENGENGKVQAALDLYGVKYTGTGYLGSALAMDKDMTRQLLIANDIPVAKGVTLQKGCSYEVPECGFPCVVKPCCGGSSVGVSIVETKEAYIDALEEAFRYEDEVVIEAFIKGREFSVGVIEGTALPIIEIAPKQGFYDYKNKYQAGSTVETCPANLPDQVTSLMQHYAEQVAKVLELDTYSRTDFMMDDSYQIYCLESNTLPGMTPTSLMPQEAKVIGISYEELCDKLIEVSLKKYEK